MRKTILGVTAALALAAPAVGTAAADKEKAPNASQACKAQRTAIGTTAFRDLYGTNKTKSNAFGKCVSKARKQTKEERTARLNAAKACKAERDADKAAFEAKYGSKRNAFGKCVSAAEKQAAA